MQLNLGFDLDEVIVDTTAEIEKYMKLEYDIYWPAEYFEYYGFNTCTFHGDKDRNKQIQDDLVVTVNDPEFQFEAKPCVGSVQAINLFKDNGHRVYFITSRPNKNRELTIKWLDKYGVQFDDLILTDHKEKGFYGRDLDMFVDDLETHLISMWSYKSHWLKGLLLFNRPWNINSTRFNRVNSWDEIVTSVGV